MNLDIVELFSQSESIRSLIDKLSFKKSNILYSTPLSGSAKSLFVSRIAEKEAQIILLLPDMQSVN
jgi:hypothetical protein